MRGNCMRGRGGDAKVLNRDMLHSNLFRERMYMSCELIRVLLRSLALQSSSYLMLVRTVTLAHDAARDDG